MYVLRSLWLLVFKTHLRLGEAGEMHLLIEEINHLLLREPEGDVSDVDSPGLAGDGGADNGHSGLERKIF